MVSATVESESDDKLMMMDGKWKWWTGKGSPSDDIRKKKESKRLDAPLCRMDSLVACTAPVQHLSTFDNKSWQ